MTVCIQLFNTFYVFTLGGKKVKMAGKRLKYGRNTGGIRGDDVLATFISFLVMLLRKPFFTIPLFVYTNKSNGIISCTTV